MWVKARLTNAVDESLVRRGMLRPDEVKAHEATIYLNVVGPVEQLIVSEEEIRDED